MITYGTVYIARGAESSLPEIEALLHASAIPMSGVDAYVRIYTHFGIDEARAIIEKAQLRGVRGGRVFVLVIAAITTEAQNALLKTCEEPPGDALIVIVVPSPDMLLPTLRSRAQTLMLEMRSESSVDVRQFCAADSVRRLELMKPLLDKGDEDPVKPQGGHGAGRRDMAAILSFLSALEIHLSTSLDKPQSREGLAAVYAARSRFGDKGALVKTLLESVAYLVPQS